MKQYSLHLCSIVLMVAPMLMAQDSDYDVLQERIARTLEATNAMVENMANIQAINHKYEQERAHKHNRLTLRGALDAVYSTGEYIHGDERWSCFFPVHYSFASKAYSCNRCCAPLANLVFGKEFTLRDIFLLAKLSDDDKLHIVPSGAPMPPFGNARDEQYLALLASTQIDIDAEFREFIFNLGAAYRLPLGDEEQYYATFGINVPVKSRRHFMDLNLVGGALFGERSQLDSTLEQFFKDFSSIEDFFARAVLAPKGLLFEERQQKGGIGDVSLYTSVDVGGYFNHVDGLQFGVNAVLPTAHKRCDKYVWEIELGNGGAFQFEAFANVLFNSGSCYFNPTFLLSGQVSSAFCAQRRIPKRKIQSVEGLLADNPAILLPVFTQYRSDPFNEYDSSVLHFADQTVCARVKQGSRVLFGIGNYFHEIFKRRFRLGVFYYFIAKGQDSVEIKQDAKCPLEGEFNTCLLQECTRERSHSFGWNLAYKFYDLCEFNVGSQHTVAGLNVPRSHDFFVSVVAVF